MSTSTPASSSSSWVPKSLLRFYSRFPLVLLPPDEEVRFDDDDGDDADEQVRRPGAGQASLWVTPPQATDAFSVDDSIAVGNFPSPSPACLRHQLLVLFRPSAATGPRRVRFRSWTAPPDRSVPGGRLPVLHVGPGGGDVRPSDQVRAWLDKEHPLADDVKDTNGMPDQDSHTRALAVAQVVMQKILPAYTALTAPAPSDLHLPPPFYQPVALPRAIYASLPYVVRNVAGGETARVKDREVKEREGVEGVRALAELRRKHYDAAGGKWFLGASSPSPLDALLASHLYAILTTLDTSSSLRQALEAEQELVAYVQRVIKEGAKQYREAEQAEKRRA